jgi:hypothetical protein
MVLRREALAFSLLTALFLSGFAAHITPAHSTVSVVTAVWASALFWSSGALAPLWGVTEFVTAYLNAVAAAMALYAGIAALQ